jgi:hypothetical protein
MHTITIASAALRYVLPHVCTEESRPSIRGVYVAPDGTISATNGKTLATHRNAATTDAPALLRFHKPASLTARKVHTVSVDVDPARTECPVTLLDDAGRVLGMTLADYLPETFPTFAPVFRGWEDKLEGTPLPAISFDPELLSLFSVSSGKYDTLQPIRLTFDTPDRGVLVTWHNNPDAIGLVMPVREPRASAIDDARIMLGYVAPVPAGV